MFSTNPVETVPLRIHENGMIYIGNTRIPLETVVDTFEEGASPEEIVMQYPALLLPDVYLIIGYYLNHRAEVNEYRAKAMAYSAKVRQENEERFKLNDLRERLLTRKPSTS